MLIFQCFILDSLVSFVPVVYTVMRRYKSKAKQIPGSSYDEVCKYARKEHQKIEKLTKRNAYVRSKYFDKDKIFLANYWTHVMQKNRKKRTKSLKLYNAAIDLLRNTHNPPETIFDKQNMSILLHRFYGITKDGIEYCVQVKQDKRTGRKDFMSVFDKKAH